MEIGCQRGMRSVHHSTMSVTRRIAGSIGKHHSFWAMYSLRMSVWIVPPNASGGTPFASAAPVVRVEAHQGGHVEGRRQPCLAVIEQVAEALVRLLGGAEAGELPHRPQPAAVHRRVDAPRERSLARIAEV